MAVAIRKIVIVVDEQITEGGAALPQPLKKIAAVAIIQNPLAGKVCADLAPLIEAGGELGRILTERIVTVLPKSAVQSFGKAAIVGAGGELEHAAALIHPIFGRSVREVLGSGRAVIPSAKKCGGPGTTIDVPLVYKEALRVASHYDAMEVRVGDAPQPGEVLVALVLTNGGRPHARIPGLQLKDARGDDGLN